MGVNSSKSSYQQLDLPNLDQTRPTSKSDASKPSKNEPKDKSGKRHILFVGDPNGRQALVKQLVFKYGVKVLKANLHHYAEEIYKLIAEEMIGLMAESEEFVQKGKEECQLGEKALKSKEFIDNCGNFDDEKGEIPQHIRIIWDDYGMQNTLKLSEIHTDNKHSYFFSKMPEVCQIGYLPTMDDYYHLHDEDDLGGIPLEENDAQFQIHELLSMSRTAMKAFTSVVEIVFVLDISIIDQPEIETLLNLFTFICSSRQFRKSAIVIVMVNSDQLVAKYDETPRPLLLAPYEAKEAEENDELCGDGEVSFNGLSKYLSDVFWSKDVKRKHKVVDTLFVEGLTVNPSDIERFMNAVRDKIVREELENAGLFNGRR